MANDGWDPAFVIRHSSYGIRHAASAIADLFALAGERARGVGCDRRNDSLGRGAGEVGGRERDGLTRGGEGLARATGVLFEDGQAVMGLEQVGIGRKRGVERLAGGR